MSSLEAAEAEATEAREHLEANLVEMTKLRAQRDEEQDLRGKVQHQLDAVKALFEEYDAHTDNTDRCFTTHAVAVAVLLWWCVV